MALLDWNGGKSRKAPPRPLSPPAITPKPVPIAAQAQQFVRKVEDYSQKVTGQAVMKAIVAVHSDEVHDLAALAARLKGRYLARLLDLPKSGKVPTSVEIEEIAALRRAFEEVDAGFALLKQATVNGALRVEGLQN